MTTKQWEREHGAEYDIPSIVEKLVKLKVLEDTSWHNDACPSFTIVDPADDQFGIILWVDHPIQFMREAEGRRFIVQMGDRGSEADREHITDELQEALEKVIEFAQDGDYAKAAIRKQSWWDDSAAAFEILREMVEALRK